MDSRFNDLLSLPFALSNFPAMVYRTRRMASNEATYIKVICFSKTAPSGIDSWGAIKTKNVNEWIYFANRSYAHVVDRILIGKKLEIFNLVREISVSGIQSTVYSPPGT